VPAVLLALVAAAAAPVPDPKAPPVKAAALRDAMGKSHLGKEVRTITRGLGAFPEIRSHRVLFQDAAKDDGKEDESFSLTWKTRGVEMACESGRVKAVWLYNQGADGYDRYPGELPAGLSFGDDPDEIERKLGKAEDRKELPEIRKVGGKLQDELWLQYDSKGLWVVLWRLPGEPYSIRFVSLQSPDEE
jgi:hypothetical protein